MPADDPGVQASPRVAGLVLAAGAGRRYGMPKALVPYEGRLLVERAYLMIAAVCDPVVVVVGAAADEVRSRAELGAAVVVVNPQWDTGMGSSLRTGLAALSGGLRQALHGPEPDPDPGGLRHHLHGPRPDPDPGGLRHNLHGPGPDPDPGGLRHNRQGGSGPGQVDAVLVHLVDLPGMTVAALRRVAAAATPDVLAVASYGGVRGHPVLLGRTHWAGVAASATGDQGARGYLAGREVTEIECADVADPADLDYPPS